MKRNTKNGNTKEREFCKIDSFSVDSARVLTYNGRESVVLNLTINGVKIYGVNVVEGKSGDFLSFPQKQGKDGKYYHIAYVALNEKDQADIIAEAERILNEE